MATQDDLDVVNARIARATRSVQLSDGSKVEFDSVADSITAANRIQSQISRAAGTRVRQIRMATSKGLRTPPSTDGFSV
jgi:ribosomal protein L14